MSDLETTRFASFDGVELAVHRLRPESGAGRPIVMLHGLFSDADMNWIKFGHAQRIAALGYDVIMPDFRAHGDSDAPHDASAYPDNVLVRDVAALVDGFGLEDYDLCGFSLGSRTSLHATANDVLHPARLVVCGMGTTGLGNWERRAAFFLRVIDKFDTIKQGDSEYFARQFLKTQGIDRVAVRQLLLTMPDLDLAKLSNVTMPTAVVCGDEDSDNGSAPELAALLPDAVYIEVPGTHMSSVTKSELGEAIAGWLGEAP